MAIDTLSQPTQSGDSAPRSAFKRGLRNALFGARLYIRSLTHPLTQEQLDEMEHQSLLAKLDDARSQGEDAHIQGGRIIVNMAMPERPLEWHEDPDLGDLYVKAAGTADFDPNPTRDDGAEH